MEEILNKIRHVVEKELSSSAHDLNHVFRVYKNALDIAEAYGNIDCDVLKAACLLHDIAKVKEESDTSGMTDHALLGADMAGCILREFQCDKVFIESVCAAVRTHRFRGGMKPDTLEAQILFDADKLDILGAVGIARCYMIAGEYGQSIFFEGDQEDYIRTNLVGQNPNGRIMNTALHTPDLEYVLKLRGMVGRLFTEKAKEIAEQRLSFMDAFFKKLYEEVGK